MNRPKIAHYYGRLKVAPDAPPEVIRAAYKALVQKYHPDRHSGSIRHEVVLAALNKAQEVLLDPERRAAHDQWIRQEEIRLGWREPEQPVDLRTRLRLLRASIRIDRLPLREACAMHLTRGQRLGLWLGTGTLAAGLLGALVWGLAPGPQDDDVLGRIVPASAFGAARGPARAR